MGGGHDGVARELARRLESQGHATEIQDFLATFPAGFGWFMRWFYRFQLRRAPWSYEVLYKAWVVVPALYRPVVWLDTFLTRRGIARRVRRFRPDVIVSTYPLSSIVLGKLRATRRLNIPAVTFVTDFSVHPLWIHSGVDLHLCIHDDPAAETGRLSRGRTVVCGPVISPRFPAPESKCEARRTLGIPDDERIVLVVAGSWGVGAVEDTVETIAATGRFTPVTICGHDDKLRRHLESRRLGHVVGWTDQMPLFMRAADAMVENAGGLTSLEAFASRLPVVSFRPIPGHGRANAAALSRAGVARFAADEEELVVHLDAVTRAGREHDESVGRGAALFQADAADLIAVAAAVGVVPLRRGRLRRVGAAAVAAAAMWLLAGVPVAFAVSRGMVMARPPVDATHAYLAVRLSGQQLADPGVRQALLMSGATVIVDGSARAQRAAIGELVGNGVDVVSGGTGWSRFPIVHSISAIRARHQLQGTAGRRVRLVVPAGRIDAVDLFLSHLYHQQLVAPTHTIRAAHMPRHYRPGQAYVLDLRGMNAGAVPAALTGVADGMASDGLAVLPFRQLA